MILDAIRLFALEAVALAVTSDSLVTQFLSTSVTMSSSSSFAASSMPQPMDLQAEMDQLAYPEGYFDEWDNETADEPQPAPPLAPDVPEELYFYLTKDLAMTEEDEIIQETCRILGTYHIKAPWQIGAAPEPLIQQAFPWESHSRHLMMITHARQEQKKTGHHDDATAQALRMMEGYLREQREDRNDRKRAREELVEEDPQQAFRCWDCLHRYHLSGVPACHMPNNNLMRTMAKRAEKDFQQSGHFMAPGPITDYMPMWVPEKFGGIDAIRTHAHWVAAYWGRALTQLAAQASANAQSVKVEDLLTEFLNMNRLCIEHKGRLGWVMDQRIWNGISDKIQRHDPNLDLHQEFTVVDQNLRTGLIADLGQPSSQQQEKFQRADSRKDWYVSKGKNKGRGKGRGRPWGPGRGVQQQQQPSAESEVPSATRTTDWKKGRGKGKGDKQKGDKPRPGQPGFQPKKEEPNY